MSVDFANLLLDGDEQNLEQVPIDKSWQLLFSGDPGDTFAAFLQSDKKITQIAPLKAQNCYCMLEPHAQTMRYPQNIQLTFDKSEGLGWRRFIVLRAKHLPLQPRDPHNTTITAQELEQFAKRVLDQKDNQVSVQVREFILVD